MACVWVNRELAKVHRSYLATQSTLPIFVDVDRIESKARWKVAVGNSFGWQVQKVDPSFQMEICL